MNYQETYKSIPYFQVNAFSEDLFGGNPAGVCPLSEWPETGLMQKLAAENDLSETAFFVPEGEGGEYKLRWFTPTVEVDFCGHATLSSGFVVLSILRPDLAEVAFETRVGVLRVKRGGSGFFILEMPVLAPKEVAITKAHEAFFGKRPTFLGEAGMNFMCVFDGGEEEILSLVPNVEAMAKFPKHGFIATSKGATADFVSRYFVPNHGILEDPVTGSAHATLAPYWAGVLGKSRLTARQISKRGGDMVLEMKGKRIEAWAKCYLYSEGVIHLSKKI